MTGPSAPGPALTDEPEPSARHAGAVGEGLPRTRLATLPTPLLPAPRLSQAVGVEVWIKRDDMTGLGLGGNKARKLEFLCGEALARGADTLVTGGGSGSNHVQLTAAAAARLGLGCVAVCYGTDPAPAEPATAGPGAGPSSGSAVPGASGRGAGRSSGSATPALGLRLTRRFGADVIFTGSPDRTSVDARLEEVAAKLAAEGRVPYVIPRGGASAVGAVGYALAAAELSDQLAEAGLAAVTLVVATGSCGTQAGLVAGVGLIADARPAPAGAEPNTGTGPVPSVWAGIVPKKRHDSCPDPDPDPDQGRRGSGSSFEVVGVPVSRPPEECVERIAGLATGCAARLGSDRVFTEADVRLLGGYLGPGYGKASPEGDEAAVLAARTEGLVLDPVFTAKAMAALVAEARAGRLTGPVVFLQTGGSPSALAALP
ncbi:MAG: D-cysteine desulfhydrase [Actinomycetota bacterium]|nr:D-cysteine desulfhydrase [Actinomycetota bacterium]